MTLAATFVEAETAAGKTTEKIIADMNKAIDGSVDRTTLWRWSNGERNPRPEVRRYMLRKAIPYLVNKAYKDETGNFGDVVTTKNVGRIVEGLL